ncbi:MAG: hypothetical protein ACFB0C_00730, partial [Leptolyngbyaceae cyanobacterium]
SVVKRICGEDTLGVAPRENSSVPGHISKAPPFQQMGELFADKWGTSGECYIRLVLSGCRKIPSLYWNTALGGFSTLC